MECDVSEEHTQTVRREMLVIAMAAILSHQKYSITSLPPQSHKTTSKTRTEGYPLLLDPDLDHCHYEPTQAVAVKLSNPQVYKRLGCLQYRSCDVYKPRIWFQTRSCLPQPAADATVINLAIRYWCRKVSSSFRRKHVVVVPVFIRSCGHKTR